MGATTDDAKSPSRESHEGDSEEADDLSNVDDQSNANDDQSVLATTIATDEGMDDSNADQDDDRSLGTTNDNDDDDMEGQSAVDDASTAATPSQSSMAATSTSPAPKKKGKWKGPPNLVRKGRAPAVKGLTIPFRTVKKAMKSDPDVPIVQNEAAIMVTLAAELFLKSLSASSQKIAKGRGRNTVKYEDIAEARSKDPALTFLETLLP